MTRKKSETELKKMMNVYEIGSHKYGDVRHTRCLTCGQTVRFCPHCRNLLLQPKSENAPDYSVWPLYTWVECKESGKNGRWAWSEISEDGERANQRSFLIKNGGWLFILLGTGRVSKNLERSGRSAYLIHFYDWVNKVEPLLNEKKMKSIRHEPTRGRTPATELLAEWRLHWGDDGWEIPNGHSWWKALYKKAEHLAAWAKANMYVKE